VLGNVIHARGGRRVIMDDSKISALAYTLCTHVKEGCTIKFATKHNQYLFYSVRKSTWFRIKTILGPEMPDTVTEVTDMELLGHIRAITMTFITQNYKWEIIGGGVND